MVAHTIVGHHLVLAVHAGWVPIGMTGSAAKAFRVIVIRSVVDRLS